MYGTDGMERIEHEMSELHPHSDDCANAAIQQAQTRKRLLAYALKLQMMREHSRQELLVKLTRKAAEKEWQANAETLDAVLGKLQQESWQSDERVVETVLHGKQHKWGSRKIVQSLQAKGLDTALVQEAKDALAGSEQDRAYEVWAKKFGNKELDATDPKVHAKQMRFLAGRGFSAEVVHGVLRRVQREAG